MIFAAFVPSFTIAEKKKEEEELFFDPPMGAATNCFIVLRYPGFSLMLICLFLLVGQVNFLKVRYADLRENIPTSFHHWHENL